MKKKVKTKKVNYEKKFLDEVNKWKDSANKSLVDAHRLFSENFEKEYKIKYDLAEKTLRHMEVVEKFLEIQTAIFKRLESKLK